MTEEQQLLQEINALLKDRVENLTAFMDLTKSKKLDPAVKRYLRIQFFTMIASLSLDRETAIDMHNKFEQLLKDK